MSLILQRTFTLKLLYLYISFLITTHVTVALLTFCLSTNQLHSALSLPLIYQPPFCGSRCNYICQRVRHVLVLLSQLLKLMMARVHVCVPV